MHSLFWASQSLNLGGETIHWETQTWHLKGYFFNTVMKVAKQSNLWFLARNYIYQWRDTGRTLKWNVTDVIRRLMLSISYSESVCHTSFNSMNVKLSWIDDSLGGEDNSLEQLNSRLQLWGFWVLYSLPSKTSNWAPQLPGVKDPKTS